MAFNLGYADKGVDLSEAGSNFKASTKTAKSKEAPKKEEPKTEAPVTDTTANKSVSASGSPASKLISIINQNGGSPSQNANPATKPVTLADTAPGNPLTSTDSLNVGIGLVHNYQQDLSKRLLTRPMQESMADMDKEAEDPNYLSLDRKNAAAMELRNSMLEAKKGGYSFNPSRLSPMAQALHSGYIQKATNKMISENKYQPYLQVGAGLNIK